MKTASSKYLTYKYSIWCGCTLREILLVSILCIVAMILLLVIVPSVIGIPGWVGLLLSGLLLKPVIKRVLMRVGEWKKNKPHGYLITIILVKMASMGLIRLPYVRRVGQWRTYRRVKG
jgi:conjugative transfer region protein (TIGR03750 family)